MKMKKVYLFFLNLLVLTTVMSVKSQDCNNMRIDVDIQDTNISVHISPAFCSFVYIVAHYVDCDEVDSIVLPQPVTTTVFARHTNSRNRITVELPDSDGAVAYKDFVDGIVGTREIQNLQFNEGNKRFEWEALEDSIRCDIIYRIRFSNEIDSEIVTDTTNPFFEISPQPCTNNEITVTPVIRFDNSYGEDAFHRHTIKLVDSKVRDLQFSEANGRFEWTEPGDSSRCDIKYTIRVNNGIDPDLTTETANPFITLSLHPCTNNEITVTTMIGFDESTGQSASLRHTVNLVDSKVRDLRFSESNNRFEWKEPEDSSRCGIKYDITVSNGIDSDLTRQTRDTFIEFSVHPCTNNEITVTTMIGFDDSTGQDASAEHTINLVDSAVQNLRFNELYNRFEWTAPEHPSRCDIKYKIRASNGIDTDQTKETRDTFIAFSFHPCTNNEITVTTMIGFDESTGQRASIRHAVNLVDSEVRDLRFSESNNRFEWTEPEDSSRCDILYDIKVSNGIDSDITRQTRHTFIVFSLHPCTNNEITVTTMIGFDESTGQSASVRHTVNLVDREVRDIRFSETNDWFEWTEPEDSSRCYITYEITVRNGIDPDQTTETTNPFITLSLHPCTNNEITVSTRIGFDGSTGEDASIDHRVYLVNSAVQDLQFSEVNNRFEWTAPEDSSRCDLTYKIRFSNEIEGDETAETANDFFEFYLHPCTNNEITVTTMIGFDGSIGQDLSAKQAISLDKGEVRHLHFNADNGRFEWEAPDDSSRCQLEYTIIYYRNGNFVTDFVTTYLFYPIPLYFCSTNLVAVATKIGFDNSVAEVEYYSHHISVPPVIEVKDIRFDESPSRFYWSAPEKSELCKLEYRVEFLNDALEEPYIVRTSKEYFEFSLYPCSNNRIKVTTLVGYDLNESEPVATEHAGPVTRQLPLHIRTNPQPTSAEVTWEIEEELYNFCDVDYLRYKVTNLDTAVETYFNTNFQEGTKVDHILKNLQVNQLYHHSLCFIFSTSDSICSDDVKFLTQTLSKPQITTVINTDENIEISWKQTYYSSFITGHTVVIQPIEPNHFVPYHCVFDKTPTIRNFEADATNYVLEYPLPSFRYDIKVITHFKGLGMTTEDADQIITKESTPANLDIQYSYKYVTMTRYDVSLLINWTIPCDINGNIQKFSYAVYKDFYNNKDAICNDLFKSGIVTVTEDERETYDIPLISNILPFFRYSVEVNTSLARHEKKTRMDLSKPPQPFAPSA